MLKNCSFNFTDESYHNVGVSWDPYQEELVDIGRFAQTKFETNKGAFKTPTLRNVALTAPYMHDGRFQTLEEVIEHYNSGVKSHRNLNFRLTEQDRDGRLGGTPLKLELTQGQKDALLAFLRTFTDDKVSTAEKYSDPFI